MRRARELTACTLLWFSCAGIAQAQETRPTLTIQSPKTSSAAQIPADVLLQLDVFVNGRPLNLISAFTVRGDGTLISSATELSEIGLQIPMSLSKAAEVPLDGLPGLAFIYDEKLQTIHFTGDEKALKPLLIYAQPVVAAPDPLRPPFGALVNYTLFASADNSKTNLTFGGLSGEFESRVLDRLGYLRTTSSQRWGESTMGSPGLIATIAMKTPRT
jgi:outer membrane usher protein